jgi:hypothetical protein
MVGNCDSVRQLECYVRLVPLASPQAAKTPFLKQAIRLFDPAQMTY